MKWLNILYFLLFALLHFSCENNGGGSSSVIKKIWSIKLNKLEGSQGFELPSIDGNYAYFPNGPNIECRELSTGKLIWSYKIVGGGRDYHGSNFSFNSNLIVINDLFSTVSLNKFTGEFIWMAPDSGIQRDYGGMSWIDEDYGYRHPFVTTPKTFIQYDLITGNTIRSIISDSGGVQSIISNQGGIFIGTIKEVRNANNEPLMEFGTVTRYNNNSGLLEYSIKAKPRWFVNTNGYGFYLQTYQNTFSVPVLKDKTGYNVFYDGTTIKFDLETGELVWKYELPITNYRRDFPGAISVFPDEEKGLVFVTGGRDSWFCLDMETGKQLYWKRLSEYDGMIDPSSYDGNRYVFKPHTYGQYEWYIIDITTGEVVEEFDIPDDSILSQDVKNGYVAAFGVGSFYVFKIVR
ncbi:MAG: PQQ-binding-like beta-propeller repeat protein [Bacteroidetes bacterium]|nr:PQQ-binding-like beta-propeller repeat protein [Bacteroidota bacterium]